MPICSYLVIPEKGAAREVEIRLGEIPGCDVVRARNRDVLILVTDTPGLEEESELRGKVEELNGIQALLLTFGEIDPETTVGDPVSVGKDGAERPRSLPVVSREGDR